MEEILNYCIKKEQQSKLIVALLVKSCKILRANQVNAKA